MRIIRRIAISIAAIAGATLAVSAVVQAHHSFAMYDLRKTVSSALGKRAKILQTFLKILSACCALSLSCLLRF